MYGAHRRQERILWKCSYRQLGAAVWVLGTGPGCCGATKPSHEPLSHYPAPHFYDFKVRHFKSFSHRIVMLTSSYCFAYSFWFVTGLFVPVIITLHLSFKNNPVLRFEPKLLGSVNALPLIYASSPVYLFVCFYWP